MTPIARAAHTMRVAADSLPLRSDNCLSPLAERLYGEAVLLEENTASLTDDLAFYVARFGTRKEIESVDAVKSVKA